LNTTNQAISAHPTSFTTMTIYVPMLNGIKTYIVYPKRAPTSSINKNRIYSNEQLADSFEPPYQYCHGKQ